mgnify:CR=1 FL=1
MDHIAYEEATLWRDNIVEEVTTDEELEQPIVVWKSTRSYDKISEVEPEKKEEQPIVVWRSAAKYTTEYDKRVVPKTSKRSKKIGFGSFTVLERDMNSKMMGFAKLSIMMAYRKNKVDPAHIRN